MTATFDRETLLDLTVNFVPLGILVFFVGGYLLANPFGWDPLASSLQFALLLAPFVFLALLTYLSGKAISESEDEQPVYMPGQAIVSGAEPLEHEESASAVEEAPTHE